ncbi:hypothetical protein LCGC14_2201770, partial [marine sediment metagenome]
TNIDFDSSVLPSYGWYEQFTSYDPSYMTSSLSPDDHSSTYTIDPLNIQNNFPNENTQEDWSNWNLNYDSQITTSSFSNGDFSSYLNTPSGYEVPTQPDNFSLPLATQGDLSSIGSPKTTINAINNPIITGGQKAGPNEWNDWSWTYGSGSTDYGTLTNNDGDTNRIDATSTEYWSLMFAESDLYNGDPTPPFSSWPWQSSPIASKIGPGPGNGEITAGGPVTPNFCVVALMDSANIPSGSYVTKIEVTAVGYYSEAIDSTVSVGFNGGPGGGKDITFTSTTGQINTVTWDNLWASQYDDADMNGMTLWLRSDNGFQFGPEQHIDSLGVRVFYKASDEYKHEYLIKWDVNDGSMSEIQNLWYEWKQTAARNTKMYTTTDGVNYNVEITGAALGSGTGYVAGSFPIGPYVRNGDEVWIKVISDEGGDFDIRFDRLYIEYTTSVPDYSIDVEVEWSVTDLDLDSMDLKFAHSSTILFDFYIWDYTGQGSWYEIVGSSPFSLTSQYYDGSNTVKVKYVTDHSSSGFTLDIDMLKIDYTYVPRGDRFADITKTISDSFLNRYDSGFSTYQKLYDITIEFDYQYLVDIPSYAQFAKFYIDSTEFDLIKDGSWHTFSNTFEFDSTSLDDFSV